MIEGPRGVRKEEFESLRDLTDVVFRPGLVDEYPQLFNEDNLENCRVMLDDGCVISHVGMTEQRAVILGCQINVACIGGVSTHPDYRKRGFATRVFEDACAKAHRDGMDFMIISGDRNLYRLAGCRRVGKDVEVTVTRRDREQLEPEGLRAEPCAAKDLDRIAALYRREPVRFLRRLEDYERAFSCRVVMNRPSEFLRIKRGDAIRAYLILQRPRKNERIAQIAEYAGERSSILKVLGEGITRYDLEGVRLHVLSCDGVFRSILEACGFRPEPSHASGTVRIVNFVQFMERMRPYFEEILGYRRAANLCFSEKRGAFIVSSGSDQVPISSRGAAAHLLFDTLEEREADPLAGGGRTAEMLREVLPIPALWYGINYI